MEAILDRKERTKPLNSSLDQSGVNGFIRSSVEGLDKIDFEWIDTTQLEDMRPISNGMLGLANSHRINDVPRVNKFIEKANRSLQKGDYLLICMETKDSRRMRILNKFPRIISRPYYILDFILKRVFPKWKVTKKIYFWVTKGRNRVISLTEGLGRLVSCGFKIVEYQRIGYLTYILSQKNSDPVYDMQPTYGPLVGLKRIGKDGELFTVYKLRTMHPYSEYLQDFMFNKNNLQEGGKIKDDFRVTGWGKLFRKLWIDELPMFINFFKGQMKLVGVRPLSRHYFSLYPEDMQQLRTQVKPGLVPPFYADLPDTLPEIIESERVYLESYLEKPIRTDIKYFFKAMYNIFIKRARSK
jgi:lipopolysaccharide/colanic/teichoic acid biosynthesis glycosyltransferase